MSIKLVVGLGNPGKKYERTRHNMGFLVVRALADGWGLTLKSERKMLGETARGRVGNKQIHLLLPTTYMNESGRAVGSYSNYYHIEAHEVLVISDDADLPFGELRFREKGSSGGHNGLKSIEQALGTQAYPRLRIGIGREGEELIGHVLGRFSPAEEKRLEGLIREAKEVVNKAITGEENDEN